MANKLSDAVAYICSQYSEANLGDLSNARLTKLIYLADWTLATETGHQLTDIKWKFNHYGPWVPDVMESIAQDERFSTEMVVNYYGARKMQITLRPEWREKLSLAAPTSLTAIELNGLDSTIKETENLYFGQFIDFVYDTFPVQHGTRHQTLNLELLAADLNSEKYKNRSVDYRKAGLDAFAYATMRDRVIKQAARLFLKVSTETVATKWQGLSEIAHFAEGSIISELSFEPEAVVLGSAGNSWLMTLSGVVQLQGTITNQGWLDLATDETDVSMAVQIVDPFWSEEEMLISKSALCEVTFAVRGTDPDSWVVELTQAEMISGE